MTRIILPPLFEELLKNDRRLRGATDSVVARFEDWLADSKMPFFPDYTDHGPTHLSAVLSTVAHLVSDDARKHLTPADAAVAVLGTLLHDIAMHITEAGFQRLVAGEAATRRIPEFDQKDWSSLWREFVYEARRWDDSKLCDVIGHGFDSASLSTLRDPFGSSISLSQDDHRVIGEFIRRHHARLAHEFAVYGVPGNDTDFIVPSTWLDADLADIAGLVARSHGMPIRNALGYLLKRYHVRDYRGVHAPYLMVLLRLSDYFQIQAERSSRVTFSYKHIPSRVSQAEHRAHRSIRSIAFAHEDPESIEVNAAPPDLAALLKVKSWLAGWQEELDASWAVLGEVYGRFKDLCNLGVIVRRVRSNIEDGSPFLEEAPYLPIKSELEVSKPELLRLLVRPLYGDRPEVGIRELVQNAVDAVLEFEHLNQSGRISPPAPRIEQESDVLIVLDRRLPGQDLVRVSDRGVGMTSEVVRRFFLTVGASYRMSDSWRANFEVSGPGGIRAAVPRSGRFGIGVLAGFLLGEKIEVTTRSPFDKHGYRFSTQLDGGLVELRKADDAPMGTEVVVHCSSAVATYLEENVYAWDYYAVTKPHVQREIWSTNSRHRVLHQRFRVPTVGFDLPQWRSVYVDGYGAVHWTHWHEAYPSHLGSFGDKRCGLWCNGILIGGRDPDLMPQVSDDAVRLNPPSISVLDPDARLPLNLQRDSVPFQRLPFQAEVSDDMALDFIAHLVDHVPKEAVCPCNPDRFEGQEQVTELAPGPWPCAWTPNGITLATRWHLCALGCRRVLLLIYYSSMYTAWGQATPRVDGVGEFDAVLVTSVHAKISDLRSLVRQGLEGAWHPAVSATVLGGRIHVSSGLGEQLFEERRIREKLRGRVAIESSADDRIYRYGIIFPSQWSHAKLRHLPDSHGYHHKEFGFLAVELFLKEEVMEPGVISRQWDRVLSSPVIPFGASPSDVVAASAMQEIESRIGAQRKAASVRRYRLGNSVGFRSLDPDR